MASFDPPDHLNVVDNHGGFTIVCTNGDTLWRPAKVARDTVGVLIAGSVNKKDFWQTTQPVTSARYKLRGYRHPVQVWWLPTGERIA